MLHYNATVELQTQATAQNAEHLVDRLAGHGYSPAVAASDYGRLELVITIPADSLSQAAATALAIAERAAGIPAVALQVLPTEEFDRRQGLEVVPELVSVAEAAQMMGVSRQRVLQLVDEGRLAHHRVGDKRTVVIARAAAERAAAERTGTVMQCVDCGKPTRPGSVRCDEDSIAFLRGALDATDE